MKSKKLIYFAPTISSQTTYYVGHERYGLMAVSPLGYMPLIQGIGWAYNIDRQYGYLKRITKTEAQALLNGHCLALAS